MKFYYTILNIQYPASPDEIKIAYRNLAKKFHPDKHVGEEAKKAAEAKFKEINEAYEALGDDEKRAQYHNSISVPTNYLYETSLHVALRSGEIKYAAMLIMNGADINTINRENKSILYYATQYLLFSPRFDSNKQKLYGYILKKVNNINVPDKEGDTPLQYLVKRLVSQSVIEENPQYEEIINIFLAKGADPNILNQDRKNLLHIFMENLIGFSPLKKKILQNFIRKIKDINSQDKFKKTVLHYAIPSFNNEAIRELLIVNADVNIPDDNGDTPLHIAAQQLNHVVINWLLQRNARIMRNKSQQTPLHSMVIKLEPTNLVVNCECCRTLQEKHIKVLNILLNTETGINDQDGFGKTPLHYAASKTYLLDYIIQLLLNRNANTNIPDSEGNTPFHCVLNSLNNGKNRLFSLTTKSLNDVGYVNLFLSNNGNINLPNKNGETPFHIIFRTHIINSDLITSLIKERIPDLTIAFNNGKSLLFTAISGGYCALTQLLINNGAKLKREDATNENIMNTAKYHDRISKPALLGKPLGITMGVLAFRAIQLSFPVLHNQNPKQNEIENKRKLEDHTHLQANKKPNIPSVEPSQPWLIFNLSMTPTNLPINLNGNSSSHSHPPTLSVGIRKRQSLN